MSNRDIVFTLKFKNQAGATMRKFKGQLKGMGAAAVKASKGLKRLGDTFKRLADKAANASRRLRSAGAAIREAGTQMTFALGAPLALAVGFTVKAFAELELAMAGVQKTVSGTPETIEKLKQQFLGLSNEIPIAAIELAAIGQVAGQLGIEAENISSFTETIAKMGIATDLSTEQAAFALARISNVMGTPQAQANNLGSAIVALGNNFAAMEPEIVAFALRIAGAGRVVGLSEGDVLGFSSALAAVGIKAQAGGTAISRAFIKIANEVANGGEKVAQFAQIAGVSTEEFARMFKEDAAGALTSFVEGLGKAQKAGVNVFGVLEDLGLQEIRTRDAMLRLSLSGDVLARSIALGNKAFKENVALNREAEIFFKATANQIKVLWNQIKNAAAIMGEAFEPVIKRVISTLSEFALKMQKWGKSLEDMNPKMKETIALVAGLVIAGGPALIFIGALTQLIGFAIAGLATFGAALTSTFAFFLTNPLGLFLLALGSVIALLVKFRNELFTVGDDTARLRDYMVAIWEEIWQKIKWVGTNIVALFAWVGDSVSGVFGKPMDNAVTDLTTAFNVFKAIGNSIIQLFQIVGLSIGQTFRIVWDVVADGFKRVWEDLVKTGKSVMAFMAGDFKDSIDIMMAPAKTTPIDNMKENFKRAIDGVTDILASDPLGDAWKGIGERGGGLYQKSLAKGFTESEALKEEVDKMVKFIASEGGPGATAGKGFGAQFNKGFKTAMGKYIAEAKDIAKQTEDAFTNSFQSIEDQLMQFVETGKFSFKSLAKSIIADFARIGIKSMIGDLMSLMSGGGVAEGGFASGLGNAAAGIGSLFGGGGGGAFGVTGGQIGPSEGGGTLSTGDAAIVGAVTAGTDAEAGFFGNFGTMLGGLGTSLMNGFKNLGTTLSGLFTTISGLFTGGGGGGGGFIGGAMKIFSAFASEGGISDALSKGGMVPAGSFVNARRFAQGGVTSGTDRIPAMLSRNEAVIPLSRNRAVPIEGNVGGATVVNITVHANDVESFKQSQSQMLARAGNAMAKARRRTQ